MSESKIKWTIGLSIALICWLALFLPIYLSPSINFPHNYTSVDDFCVDCLDIQSTTCTYRSYNDGPNLLGICYISFIDYRFVASNNRTYHCAVKRQDSLNTNQPLIVDFQQNFVNQSCGHQVYYKTSDLTDCYTDITKFQDAFSAFCFMALFSLVMIVVIAFVPFYVSRVNRQQEDYYQTIQ